MWVVAVIGVIVAITVFVIGFAIGRHDAEEEARWQEVGERIARNHSPARLEGIGRDDGRTVRPHEPRET